MSDSSGHVGGIMTKDEMLKQISHLQAELSVLRAESRVIKSRRTRLTSLSGESCDFVEALPSSISVKELRTKVAESKNMKMSRVQFFRTGGQEPIADDEEVHHEFRTSSDMVFDYASVGDPLLLVLLAETRIAFTGRVKCTLDHADEFGTAFQRGTWVDEWADMAMEIKDLGRGKNDQLRIFVGNVDLVRYGKLDNPHIRQLETWGNKSAGDLNMKVSNDKTSPPIGGPLSAGLFTITLVPSAGAIGFFVADRPAFPREGTVRQLGMLEAGDMVRILEVVTPEPPPGTWEREYAHFTYGRIDYEGQTGWVPLRNAKNGEMFVAMADAEKLSTVQISRYYYVERGDGKCGCSDISQVWFAEERDCAAFVIAFSSWQRDNPQPKLTCGRSDD